MDLGGLWNWEKQKLSADVDLSVHREADEDDAAFAESLLAAEPVDDAGSKKRKKMKKDNQDGKDEGLKRTSSTKSMASKSAPALMKGLDPLMMTAADRNMNKQHLTPIKTLPYRRRLDKKLEALKVPDRKPKTYSSPMIKPRHRGKTRLEALAQVPSFSNTQGQEVVLDKSKPMLAEKSYDGDLFGTRGDYIGGMVYRSRMKKDLRNLSAQVENATPEEDYDELTFNEDGEEEVEGKGATDSIVNVEVVQEVEKEDDQWEAKRRCAATLRNWSFKESNRMRMVQEGSIKALIKLSVIPDKKTREYCATAFRNLCSQPDLRKHFISDSASITAIVELCNSNGYEVSKECAAALCNLSCMPGSESTLVDEGAVPQLMALLQEFSDIAPLCSRTLFNLTCVSEGYDRIERVIKATVTLCCSPASSVVTKENCVSALCNLSNIPRVHARMVDEGVVNTLSGLVRDSSDKTKMLMALVMNNLASEKSIRGELVKKGTVQVLITLADTDELERQHWCAAAIFKLVQDKGSRVRIVEEGAVSALSTISKAADKGKRPATMRLCAGALLTLATFEDSKQMIVDQGAVPVLIALAKSADVETKQNCTLGLCSLLSLRDSAISIMQQGAVSALVQLSNNDNEDTRASCAAVLFNLSCSATTGELVVKEGFVPAILTLAKARRQPTKLCCAATLCNLATIEPNRRRMVDERVVPCLVSLMSHAASCEPPDNECVRHCTAALCSLSYDSTNTIEIVKDVKVMRAIAQGTWTEVETQKSMCTVLANLTFLEASRASLAELGAVSQLIQLSKLDDASTRHRCALAFCNLSCETSIREKLVEEGVVKVLASLSDSSYKEDNQQDCAKAICNLSAHEGVELQIVNAGAVPSIMMVAMVRAVKPETKEVSAKSLLNLLTKESLPLMVGQGLETALAHLAKLEASMNTCSRGYAMITATKVGRDAMCAKKSLVTPLFRMINTPKCSIATKVIAGKAVCNLLMRDDSRIPTVEAGAVQVLAQLAKIGLSEQGSEEDKEAAATAAVITADALHMLSCCEVSRASLLKEKALPQLTKMAHAHPALAPKLSVSRALAQMAWFETTRVQVADTGILSVIDQLVSTTTFSSLQTDNSTKRSTSIVPVLESCVRALCYLSMDLSESTLATMVDCGMTNALVRVRERLVKEAPVAVSTNCDQLIALTLRNLSTISSGSKFHVRMVKDGAVPLLCTLVRTIAVQAAKAESKAKDAEEGAAPSSEFEYALAMNVDCSLAFCNLAFHAVLRESLLEQGVLDALKTLAKIGVSDFDGNWRCAAALRFLAVSAENRAAMVQGQAVVTLVALAGRPGARMETQRECCAAVCSLSSTKSTNVRMAIVQQGATPLLIRLSKSDNPPTVKSCSVALSNLSTAGTDVEEGTVAALISMSIDDDDALASGEASSLVLESVVVDEQDLPPPLALRSMVAPGVDALVEVRSVHVVTRSKQTAGMSGGGPPTECPDLMEPKPLPIAGGGGMGEDEGEDESEGAAGRRTFPKLEPSPALQNELLSTAVEEDDDFYEN